MRSCWVKETVRETVDHRHHSRHHSLLRRFFYSHFKASQAKLKQINSSTIETTTTTSTTIVIPFTCSWEKKRETPFEVQWRVFCIFEVSLGSEFIIEAETTRQGNWNYSTTQNNKRRVRAFRGLYWKELLWKLSSFSCKWVNTPSSSFSMRISCAQTLQESVCNVSKWWYTSWTGSKEETFLNEYFKMHFWNINIYRRWYEKHDLDCLKDQLYRVLVEVINVYWSADDDVFTSLSSWDESEKRG